MWRACGSPPPPPPSWFWSLCKKALQTFSSHIEQPYLETHDELLMHMNSFHICWVNWHVGPSVDSIRGVYVPMPYCAISCKPDAVSRPCLLAFNHWCTLHVHAFFFFQQRAAPKVTRLANRVIKPWLQ